MSEKIYLHLLILCGTLCPGIIATFSDENTRKSSDFLVRKRRVINHLHRTTSTRIQDANYMVSIQEESQVNCAGVILSHHIVLTASLCIQYELTAYKILSGGVYSFRSETHAITSKLEHYGNLPHQKYDGIALLKVDPLFEFDAKTGNIHLHVGLLPAGTLVTVFGWGRVYPLQPAPNTQNRRLLASITLPIMNHGECHNIYRGAFNITEKCICTYCPHQYCARTDAGAPLVYNGMLVGIHIWKGELEGRINPDVFLDLRRNDYTEWIRDNILLH